MRLYNGDSDNLHYTIQHFDKWGKIVDSDDCDTETKHLVQLIDDRPDIGHELIAAINWSKDIKPEKANMEPTTAHRSKGLEGDHVFICDDFEAILFSYIEGENLAQEELHLFYVALTRAKKSLVLSDAIFNALASRNNLKSSGCVWSRF